MSFGKSSKVSKYIWIRNAPIHWNEGLVTRKFSQYGSVEEVTLIPSHPNNPVKCQSVIIEFESEDDAAAAVEESSTTEQEYTVTFHIPASASTYVLEDNATPEDLQPTFRLIPCANSNCPKQLILESDKVYCAPDCYFESVDMTGRVNIFNKFIACMGRSGTGMLEDVDKLDKVTVTVDRDGNRSSMFYPPTKK